jgi:hypothetical protein
MFHYNSEIWLGRHLHTISKLQLRSASANAIWSCMPLSYPFISFESIYKNLKFSTSTETGYYKLTLLLCKTFHSDSQNNDWFELADLILIVGRQTTFNSFAEKINK